MSYHDQISDFVAASDAATSALGAMRARAVNTTEHPQTANVALYDEGMMYVRWKRVGRRRTDPVVIRWAEVSSFGHSETLLTVGNEMWPSRELRITAASADGGEQVHTIVLMYRWMDAGAIADEIRGRTHASRARRRQVGIERGEPWPGADVSIGPDALVGGGRKGRTVPFGEVQAVVAQSHRRGPRLVADVAGSQGVEEIVLGALARLGDPDVLSAWLMDGSRRQRGVV